MDGPLGLSEESDDLDGIVDIDGSRVCGPCVCVCVCVCVWKELHFLLPMSLVGVSGRGTGGLGGYLEWAILACLGQVELESLQKVNQTGSSWPRGDLVPL